MYKIVCETIQNIDTKFCALQKDLSITLKDSEIFQGKFCQTRTRFYRKFLFLLLGFICDLVKERLLNNFETHL